MTKNKAHEKFLRWIEAHPSDQWSIVGSDMIDLNMYAGTATIDGPDIFASDHIEINYDNISCKNETPSLQDNKNKKKYTPPRYDETYFDGIVQMEEDWFKK